MYSLSSKLNTSASNLINLHTELAEFTPVEFEYNSGALLTNDDVIEVDDKTDGFVSISYAD